MAIDQEDTMTTTTSTPKSEAIKTGFRISRPSEAVRFIIAGVVLLAVSVSSLFGAVTSWSQIDTSGFVGYHYVQAIIAALGCALVVGGIAQESDAALKSTYPAQSVAGVCHSTLVVRKQATAEPATHVPAPRAMTAQQPLAGIFRPAIRPRSSGRKPQRNPRRVFLPPEP